MIPNLAIDEKEACPSRIWLFLIASLALGLRLWGIWFGLPNLYHADEPIVVNHAMAFGVGDFNPHFFKIPPLVSYLLFGVYGLFFVVGKVLGFFPTAGDFALRFVQNPTPFYLLARIIFGALLGTVNVLLLYQLVRTHFGNRTALFSALFLSVAFLHVRDSHYVYADIPLLVALTVCFIFMLCLVEYPMRRYYLLCGLWMGIAVAVKYNGAVIIIPFLIAHLVSARERVNSRGGIDLLLAGLVTVSTFLCLNPFSLLDWRFFVSEIRTQASAESTMDLFHHLSYSLNGGIGFPLLGAALAGMGRCLIRCDRKRLVMISFVLVYYFVLAWKSQPYDRYVLPLVPVLCFFAADLISGWKEQGMHRAAVVSLIVAAVSVPLSKDLLCNVLFTREDVRDTARRWIENNVQSGSMVAVEDPFFMPRLRPSLRQLEEKMRESKVTDSLTNVRGRRLNLMIGDAQRSEASRYELFYMKLEPENSGFTFSNPSVPYDMGELQKRGIGVVVVAKTGDPGKRSFEQMLVGKSKLLAIRKGFNL